MLTLRDARREDVPAIVQMLADDTLGASREQPDDPLPQQYFDAFDAIVRQANNRLLVAEQDRVLVGCLQLILIASLSMVGTLRAEIEGVRVAASHRGTGIGTRMMHAALTIARVEGAGIVQLSTNVSRIDAQRFYDRLGFVASHVGMKRRLDDHRERGDEVLPHVPRSP